MYKGEGLNGFLVKREKQSKYLILSINKETLMVESGVYGDFLRGVFEYQAHFQNLFKKIKLKLFKIKIEYF